MRDSASVHGTETEVPNGAPMHLVATNTAYLWCLGPRFTAMFVATQFIGAPLGSSLSVHAQHEVREVALSEARGTSRLGRAEEDVERGADGGQRDSVLLAQEDFFRVARESAEHCAALWEGWGADAKLRDVEEGREGEKDVLDPVIFRRVDEAGGGAEIVPGRLDTRRARILISGRAWSVGSGSELRRVGSGRRGPL
jgi:hypothetical protein